MDWKSLNEIMFALPIELIAISASEFIWFSGYNMVFFITGPAIDTNDPVIFPIIEKQWNKQAK